MHRARYFLHCAVGTGDAATPIPTNALGCGLSTKQAAWTLNGGSRACRDAGAGTGATSLSLRTPGIDPHRLECVAYAVHREFRKRGGSKNDRAGLPRTGYDRSVCCGDAIGENRGAFRPRQRCDWNAAFHADRETVQRTSCLASSKLSLQRIDFSRRKRSKMRKRAKAIVEALNAILATPQQIKIVRLAGSATVLSANMTVLVYLIIPFSR